MCVVEVTGLEPAASWSQTRHSTKLSYTSLSLNASREAGRVEDESLSIIAHSVPVVKIKLGKRSPIADERQTGRQNCPLRFSKVSITTTQSASAV